MTDAPPIISPRVLTLEQAAAYLSAPVAWVRRQGIGRVRFGARTGYDRQALDAWLDERRGVHTKSAASPEDDAEAALARISERLANASRRS